MKKSRTVSSIIVCVVLSFLQIFMLCGCIFVGDKKTADGSDDAEQTVRDDTEVAAVGQCSVGAQSFQSARVAEYVNAVYNHAIYYDTWIFERLTDGLSEYLKGGGTVAYNLYASNDTLSIIGANRLLIAEFDGDALPSECETQGMIICHVLVLTETGVESSKYMGSARKKDEDAVSEYEKAKARAAYLGAYKITYNGKPDAANYAVVGDNLRAILKGCLTKSFESGDGAYDKMPSGKYSVIMAPAFTSDYNAYVYFKYENGGGLYAAYWPGYRHASPGSAASIRDVSFLNIANDPSALERTELQIADSPCTFEIEK